MFSSLEILKLVNVKSFQFGQPIRFLLKYLKIDYEETTYPCRLGTKFTEWDAVKETLGLDFPNVRCNCI